MTRRASPAQARRLAVLFGEDCAQEVSRDGGDQPTIRALVARGWIEPTGASGLWPSGRHAYDEYRINAAGLRALEDYLRATREAREAAP